MAMQSDGYEGDEARKTTKFSLLLRPRLIPLTMAVAVLLLGVKVDAIIDGTQAWRVSQATAAQDAFAADDTEEKVEEEHAAEAEEAESSEDAEEGEAGDEGEQAAGDGPTKLSVDSEEALDPVEVDEPRRHFTQIEIDLLQSLSERRDEIDDWEKELEMRANILAATEQRIGDKISEMEGLKGEIEALMVQYDENEDTKIRSLVKIYENMKPKDAARIFEEVEMPILLLVVDRMKEKKVAPILAKMSAMKAKEITMQLAEQRKLQKNVTDSAQALQNP